MTRPKTQSDTIYLYKAIILLWSVRSGGKGCKVGGKGCKVGGAFFLVLFFRPDFYVNQVHRHMHKIYVVSYCASLTRLTRLTWYAPGFPCGRRCYPNGEQSAPSQPLPSADGSLPVKNEIPGAAYASGAGSVHYPDSKRKKAACIDRPNSQPCGLLLYPFTGYHAAQDQRHSRGG